MRKTVAALSLFILLSACSSAELQSKKLVIQGSDTEVQLVSTLVEAFDKANPGAEISVAGGGSAVGIASLINGETDIANSSRKMKKEELEKAKQRGLDVREFTFAIDGLSVVVHPSNVLRHLTLQQIGDIFKGTITNWKDVGGADAPIVLYGRQSTSGTFSFFRDTVLKGDYAKTMRQMEGNEAIVSAVKADMNGIGYVGVGYVKDAMGKQLKDLNVLSVAKDAQSAPLSPLDEGVVERGEYAIARHIYQYMPQAPTSGSLLEKFLRFETSIEGQAIVNQGGFYPINDADQTQNAEVFVHTK